MFGVRGGDADKTLGFGVGAPKEDGEPEEESDAQVTLAGYSHACESQESQGLP